LVRNNWYSTAVAAALDAANRHISLFAPPQHVVDGRQAEQAHDVAAPEVTAPPAQAEAPCDEEHVETDVRIPRVAALAPIEQIEPKPAFAETADLPTEPAPALPVEPAHPEFSPARSSPLDVALGVEIGATSVRTVAVDPAGRILADERRPSRPTAEPDLTLGMAVEAARAAIVSLNSCANRLAAAGVTMPGRLRLRDGICVSCGDFPAWREVPISQTFVSALDMPVSLIGTTEAAALAELRFGAAQGLSSLLFVTVGIELDIAVIADGRPLMLGEAVPGQAGHMVVAPGGPRCSCGESGCWQAVAGRDALVARVVRDIRRGIPSAISAAVENRLSAVAPALICQMAAVGDSVAKNALEETGRFLALGIGNLITLFDPEAVILESAPAPVASELRRATEMAMKTSQRSHIFSRCVMLSPVLGDAARVLGAAAWAGQNVAQH
jgi:glucokinase